MNPSTRIVLAAAFLLSFAGRALAGGARIVEPTGTQSFASPGDAVAAAPEGAVILVGSGTYPGFTITDKSVSVFALPGAQVTLTSPIEIQGLSASKTIVLHGIDVVVPDGTTLFPAPAALTTSSSSGQIRIESCTFDPSDPAPSACPLTLLPGPPAVRIGFSTRVVLQGCTLTGGRGYAPDPSVSPSCAGAPGGAGLATYFAGVALYDCTVIGGVGGDSPVTPGQGGNALNPEIFSILASNVLAVGGTGGAHLGATPGALGGSGGTGYQFAKGVLYTVDGLLQGGAGGAGPGGSGPSGPPFASGFPVVLNGPARVATVTSAVLADLSSSSIAYQGLPGERALLLTSLEPGYAQSPIAHGTWLVQRSMLAAIDTLGTTDGAGVVSATLPTGDLPAGSLLQKRFVQAASTTGGAIWIGSSAAQIVLDRDSGPDCDGNGVSDFVDVLLGTVADANDNLIPDSCPGG